MPQTERVLSTYRKAVPAQHNLTASELTPRVHDVLTLIGRGLSNSEIAVKLSISGVTAKSHIGRSFAKLDLRDRAAAIVYAYDTGIVTPS